jgi:hypothetical protein
MKVLRVLGTPSKGKVSGNRRFLEARRFTNIHDTSASNEHENPCRDNKDHFMYQ